MYAAARSRSAMHLSTNRFLARRTIASKSTITSCSAAAPPPTSSSTPAASPLPRVVLKGGKSKLFSEHGNPVVYAGAIDRVVGRPTPSTGDPVLVQDGSEKTVAWGVFNAVSMFRVRIFDTLDDRTSSSATAQDYSITEVLNKRIQDAIQLRQLLGLPSKDTNVYRLLNSEGDGLSGLVVDVLGPHNMVVSSSAAWIEKYKDTIMQLLKKHSGIEAITWRPSLDMLAEEGWPVPESNDTMAADNSTNEEDKVLHVVEHGVKFLADPLGQKTGFYSDQRDHRRFIQQLSAGKSVLDVCCFTGGFAINAAVGGATSVTGIDSSGPALELATKNAALNNIDDSKCHFLRADAASFMKSAVQEGQQWDIVILDPPKLAPNKKSLPNALRKYKNLNENAMKLVKPGGLLMTCSCSGAVAQSDSFMPMLIKASKSAGRSITLLREGGAAADHPLSLTFPEGKYLTNCLLRVL